MVFMSAWKESLKKFWHFFWHEDTLASWIVNIIVAFVLIRFVLYPVLGILLGTSFPIVAVLSESMQHNVHNEHICGKFIEKLDDSSLESYWKECGKWYESKGISKAQFSQFPFPNGFNKGDVIILGKATVSNLEIGDVLVFVGNKPQPIIHRIVRIYEEDGKTYYQTKGDHNKESIQGTLGETKIGEERLLGQGIFRIPYLGWIKIIFVDILKLVGITIQR